VHAQVGADHGVGADAHRGGAARVEERRAVLPDELLLLRAGEAAARHHRPRDQLPVGRRRGEVQDGVDRLDESVNIGLLGEETRFEFDRGRAGRGHVADRQPTHAARAQQGWGDREYVGVPVQPVPSGRVRVGVPALDDERVQVGTVRARASPVHDGAAAVVAGKAEAVAGAEVEAHDERVVLQVPAHAGQRHLHR
jgi:hypothetical protein